MISKDSILEYLQNYYSIHGNTPTKQNIIDDPSKSFGYNSIISKFGTLNNALTKANIPLTYKKPQAKPQIKCLHCGKLTKNKKFCSQSCAASHNNKKYPKRVSNRTCAKCGSPDMKSNKSKYCTKCSRSTPISNKTLKEVIEQNYNQASNLFTPIRDHARRTHYKPGLPCSKCGYNKHVEVCHITPISDFPLDTKVSVINHKNNILILCPNCHWEHDNL